LLAFNALTLLVEWQEGHLACKKTEWLGAGMVICLELGVDLHIAQVTPLPLTVSCFREIQVGFTFLVPAHPGSPGQRAIKRMCVSVLCFPIIAPCSRQKPRHHPTTLFFTGQMPFLPPNQQRQSTEGKTT